MPDRLHCSHSSILPFPCIHTFNYFSQQFALLFFSLSAISFINQLYRVKRSLSICNPLILFSLMECRRLLYFWRAPLYHGLPKPAMGFRSCDYSSHSRWQVQLYSLKYIPTFWLAHHSPQRNTTVWKTVQIPAVGKIINTFTVGLL